MLGLRLIHVNKRGHWSELYLHFYINLISFDHLVKTSQIAWIVGPTWDLVAPGGPQVGPMNLAIRVPKQIKHGSPMTQSDIWGILHTAQNWQWQDLGHTLDSRQKQHISSHRWDSGCLLSVFAGKLTMIQWHYTVIQSGAIMTRSNITRYFKQHCMVRHII